MFENDPGESVIQRVNIRWQKVKRTLLIPNRKGKLHV